MENSQDFGLTSHLLGIFEIFPIFSCGKTTRDAAFTSVVKNIVNQFEERPKMINLLYLYRMIPSFLPQWGNYTSD